MCKLTDMRSSSALQVKWVIFDEVGLSANAIAQMGVIVCGSDLRGVCEESRKASSASMQFEALQHAYSQLAQYFKQAGSSLDRQQKFTCANLPTDAD